MHIAATAQTVGAGKAVAHFQAGLSGHLLANDGLHRLRPHGALANFGVVVLEVFIGGADDAKPTKAVAQADWNDFGHLRMAFQRLDGSQGHVTGRHIEVKNTRQN